MKNNITNWYVVAYQATKKKKASYNEFTLDFRRLSQAQIAFPEAESLPEALARYFAHFNEFHFADLMKKHGILYEKLFFLYFDDFDNVD